MSIRFTDYKIVFIGGSSLVIENVTRQDLRDGVLHLFKKNGEGAQEEHLGSFPMQHVKRWYTRESFPYSGPRKEWPE